MTELLFYAFAAIAIVSGVLAISRKNAVWAALWLVLMFFGLAGTYVLLEAFFVAAIQVLVYAGAIMVLFLFVIMLLDLRSEELAVRAAPRFRWAGVGAAAAFLALSAALIVGTGDAAWWEGSGGPDGGPQGIADALFNRWVLAFEVTSLLLLAAILGAVLLTKRRLT
jgi:NADH-quinone oxidoreductase subunit J